MLENQIYKDLSDRCRLSVYRPPAIFAEVLDPLGVKRETVAECLGLAQPTISLWATGRQPISAYQFPRLIILAREACDAAVMLLGVAAADPHKDAVMAAAVAEYSRDVGLAGEALRRLEATRNG